MSTRQEIRDYARNRAMREALRGVAWLLGVLTFYITVVLTAAWYWGWS